MNTVVLRYAVEIEKTGSITQAANNLFMEQPNLSKAIKALEESLGAPIFKRTSKGVVPTARGRVFLEHARNILSQIEEMEALYRPEAGGVEFSLSMPRASYISQAFSKFACRLDRKEGLNLWLRETNSAETLRDVERGEYRLGIIRYLVSSEHYYRKRLEDVGLKAELVWEYDCRLLMSQSHPLASEEVIGPEQLSSYVEIAHGDATVSHGAREEEQGKARPRSRIYVFERGSQLNLLHVLSDAYMWVSPVPKEILEQNGLVEKPCADFRHRCRDVLIWRKGCQLTRWDRLFLEELAGVKEHINSNRAEG